MWIQSNWFISRSNISRQHKPKKIREDICIQPMETWDCRFVSEFYQLIQLKIAHIFKTLANTPSENSTNSKITNKFPNSQHKNTNTVPKIHERKNQSISTDHNGKNEQGCIPDVDVKISSAEMVKLRIERTKRSITDEKVQGIRAIRSMILSFREREWERGTMVLPSVGRRRSRETPLFHFFTPIKKIICINYGLFYLGPLINIEFTYHLLFLKKYFKTFFLIFYLWLFENFWGFNMG